MPTVTLDTCVFPVSEVRARAEDLGFELAVVSVSVREAAGSSLESEIRALKRLFETAVWGEFQWGSAQWADPDSTATIEKALDLISNGSFPPVKQREKLLVGQKHILRDALILAAHVREKRDILVTNDSKGFIRHGRRERIEREFSTQIMTLNEFEGYVLKVSKSGG